VVDLLRPDANHLACMQQFQAARIYILAGLDGTREGLRFGQTWDHSLQRRYQTIIDSLLPFPNVLGFYINSSPITVPLARAAIRDTKAYIRSYGARRVPVGHFGGFFIDDLSGNMLNCGNRAILEDFKLYHHMDESTFCSATPELRRQYYELLAAQEANYSAPLILSQQLCNQTSQADIEAIKGIYRPPIADFHSGLVMNGYFGDPNDNMTGNSSREDFTCC
jgi:1,3-beta-glucanosyltransferase GAS1